jgi:hypothetical protein
MFIFSTDMINEMVGLEYNLNYLSQKLQVKPMLFNDEYFFPSDN